MSKKTTSSHNVKLRHSTGAYLHMVDAPNEEDMVFYLSSQKHKTAQLEAINKAFGEHKADVIESILRTLEVKGQISRAGVTNVKNIITLV